jgi:hypothetical protein
MISIETVNGHEYSQLAHRFLFMEISSKGVETATGRGLSRRAEEAASLEKPRAAQAIAWQGASIIPSDLDRSGGLFPEAPTPLSPACKAFPISVFERFAGVTGGLKRVGSRSPSTMGTAGADGFAPAR